MALLPALNLEFFYGQVDAVMLLLLALTAVGLTGVLVTDVVLGAEGARRVLLLRPYALAYTALLLGLAWQCRRAGAPVSHTGSAPAPLPRTLRPGA